MFTISREFNNILQALIVVILIGMMYSLWITTKTYGGLIGHAVRLMGVGIILISIVVIEKMMINFSVVVNSINLQLAQDILTLLALIFLLLGFKRLASVATNS